MISWQCDLKILPIQNVLKKMSWCPQSPQLFDLMLYTRRDGRITEYIPMKFGLNETELRDGELWINGKRAELKAVDYNAARTEDATKKELRTLKSGGVNTVCVAYPQPRWFYELCNEVGMYVIDQANINAGYRTNDRNVGGSLVNNPAFLPQFIDRAATIAIVFFVLLLIFTAATMKVSNKNVHYDS